MAVGVGYYGYCTSSLWRRCVRPCLQILLMAGKACFVCQRCSNEQAYVMVKVQSMTVRCVCKQ
jgi:hypothetical protein